MSIPDATTTPPPPVEAEAPSQPAKSHTQLEAAIDPAPTPSPRLAHLDNVPSATSAAVAATSASASASSPSNGMSPAHQPTESSRHSTPATSAAGSDHAPSTLTTTEPSSSSAKPLVDASDNQPTTEHPPQPSAPSSSQDKQPQQPQQQSLQDHPLASIQPAYFYPSDVSTSSAHDGIPVFEPTMQQFQDFYAYCQAVDSWGMLYGIVKVVPPKEWRDSLPDLRPLEKQSSSAAESQADTVEPDQHADISKARIRNAIVQHFTPAGSGVWRQINTTRSAKIWNAKQWADVCLSEEQKGPEMYRMKWKVDVEGVSNGGWGPKNIGTKDCAASSSILEEDGVRTRSGKARPSIVAAAGEAKTNGKRKRAEPEQDHQDKSAESAQEQVRPTTPPPASLLSPSSPERRSQRIVHNSTVKTPPPPPAASRDASVVKPKKKEAEATTHDEWCAFDYKNCWRKEALSREQLAQLEAQPDASASKLSQPSDALTASLGESSAAAPVTLPSPSEWTPEVCREIESEYWRSLNFGKPPMYGADLSGTLFDDRTKYWNVGKLDSVLTRLRLKRKLPGVNTPYLYWGMWRATFAWHVEDMDLYSINYIHFGAPKQWYAIRQADRQRFESAMAGAFPSDARRCPHFMRHKSYLASPSFLASHGIRPLKLVQNAGEFVITYPYGYHSGFNLGYNCAESVNFALESWLDIGRKANYCHCDQSQNSVRIDVDALLEESKEMEELERKRELRRAKEEAVHAIEGEEMEKRRIRNEKAKERRKLKKEAEEAAAAAAGPALPVPFQGGADFYVDPKQAATSPCVFCPADVHTDLVATPAAIESTNSKLTAMSGRHAHRLCASFVPETWVGKQGKAEVVCGIEGIDKARFSLKCQICPNPSLQKLYPKIQCTRGKCPRSAHVSCALVEEHGWFVDVCPAETADRLEGKKAAATSVPQNDGLEDGERLVVLCKTHNPLFREAEEARKAEELRERIYALPIPSMVKIKTPGGMFQALMVEIHEDEDEIVIEDEGRPSTVKFQQIILDSPAAADEVKAEPQTVAVAASTDAVATDGDAPPPGKRRRKASEKASANAKAASEEAVEASLAVSDAALLAASVKRPRKSRSAAAATAPPSDAPLETPAAQPTADGAVKPKPKRQRQSKKKAQAAEAQNVITPPPPEVHQQPPVAWPGHPMHQGAPQQQQQQQQPQQVKPPHVPSKRGPRATYAAQPPTASQPPQYSEHYAHTQQQHQHQHQQYHPSSEFGPMQHRGQPYPKIGDAGPYGAQYAPGHPPGFGRGEYNAGGAASPSYAHAQPHAHPHAHQQHPRASHNGHSYGPGPSPYAPYQQAGGAHPAYAAGADGGNHGRHPASASTSSSPAPPSVLSASSPGVTSASQYGYLAAPPAGYRDRSPPLPTFAKPMTHQGHPAGGETHGRGYPDYRPPYHHAAPPGLHPGYSSHFAPQQQQRPHHSSQSQQYQGQDYASIPGYGYHYPSQPLPSPYDGPVHPQQHRQQHQQHPGTSPAGYGAYGHYPGHPYHHHPQQPQAQQPTHQQQ